jgi:PTH1 family peptidyl-tRNA hydrolase
MILIVGLGNPGRKYTKTRHNIGSRIIDALKKEISDEKVILFKPDTFMNNSGKAVREEINYYKIPVENLIVIHDDIDLSFGIIRVSKNVSSAGHKGVQSIIDELGTQDFTRVRIGIKPDYKVDTEKFVLEKFPKQEEKQLKEIIKKAVSELKQLL